MTEKTHQEIITKLAESLSQIETESKFLRNLGNPDGSQYEECWHEFEKKYRDHVIIYILKKARWRQEERDKAQDILQLVCVKGFVSNFRNGIEKGKFRIAIRRLVMDVLRDYFREAGRLNHPVFLGDQDPQDEFADDRKLPPCEVEEILAVAAKVLSGYPEPERSLLDWIWKHEGVWPRSKELIGIMGLPTEEAARKWKQRHSHLWEDFQGKVEKALGESQ